MPTCNSSNHLLYPQSKFLRNQTNITTQSNKKIKINTVHAMIFFECIPEMERYRPRERRVTLWWRRRSSPEAMAGGVGVRRSRGDGRELGERDGRPMGDHKSKQGFLLMIGKSGKRLENCERAESEEEKMGEQGRGKMLASEWGDLTRDRRGK
jgi:hypothetical protein